MAKEAEEPDEDSRDQQGESKTVKEAHRWRRLYLLQADEDFGTGPVGGLAEAHLPKASSQDPNPQSEKLEIKVFHGYLNSVRSLLIWPSHCMKFCRDTFSSWSAA